MGLMRWIPADWQRPLPTPRQYLPVIIMIGYVAFLISGFGQFLGTAQPLPIYLFIAFLLLIVQGMLHEGASFPRLLFMHTSAGVAILYAASYAYNRSPQSWTHQALPYILFHLWVWGVFLYDVVDRRIGTPAPEVATATADDISEADTTIRLDDRRRLTPVTYGAIGTDCAALALLSFALATMLDYVGPQNLFALFNLPHTQTPYVVVDLNESLGLRLNDNVNTLENLDLSIAYLALAAALLLLGIVGVLKLVSRRENAAASELIESGEAGRSFGDAARTTVRAAVNQLLLALRRPAVAVMWYYPAFLIALFAGRLVDYFNAAASVIVFNLQDLFNPFAAAGIDNFFQGWFTALLLIVACFLVLVIVALNRHDSHLVSSASRETVALIPTIAFTSALFLTSLAAINGVIVLVFGIYAGPFQLGMASAILLLIAGVGYLVTRPREQRRRRGTPGLALRIGTSLRRPA